MKKKRISKKAIRKKYPQKKDGGEKVSSFAMRVFFVLGIFIFVALSRDLYHLTH